MLSLTKEEGKNNNEYKIIPTSLNRLKVDQLIYNL